MTVPHTAHMSAPLQPVWLTLVEEVSVETLAVVFPLDKKSAGNF